VKHRIQCRGFRAYAKGTLVGFCVLHIPELRVTIFDVALHQKNAARWAQLPSKPIVRDGRHVIDEASGKPQYTPLVEFEGRETRDAFSQAVWSAVLDRYPQALETAEAAP
jgi:hypothetical protein